MKSALVALVAAAGCIDDHYACMQDSDCNLGSAGRCELDHLCTQYDEKCPLARSYSPHSGELSGQCFVEHSTLVDPCAAGQPPEAPDGTYAGVCAALPTCCTTGWSEPCVDLAQLQYKPRCDTRIALTAWNHNPTVPNPIALYDLRYDGTQWQVIAAPTRSTFLDWIGPSPTDTTGTPRLASLDATATNLVVDDGVPFPIPTDRTFDTLSSVDFERSGHDTAMLSSNNLLQASDGIAHVLFDLDSGATRSLMSTQSAALESWADVDGDAFPDAIAETAGTASYHFVSNVDDPGDHTRQLDDNTGTSGAGGDAPVIGAFDWVDLDGDTRLDLVEIGSQVAIHLAPAAGGPLFYQPTARIDCDPPQSGTNCPGSQASSSVGFVGAVVPGTGAVDIVVGVDDETLDMEMPGQPTFRSHVLYRIQKATTTMPTVDILFRDCAGTGLAGSKCPLFRSVVARDLDHDGVLDLVAIDNALDVYTFHARGNGLYDTPAVQSLQIVPTTAYQYVRASVTGALSP